MFMLKSLILARLLRALSTLRQRSISLLSALAFLIFKTEAALAVMPKAPKADGAVEDGDWLGYLRSYWKQAIALLVLMLCSYGLVKIAGNAIKMYHEYSNGKAELADLIIQIVIGFVILVIMVLLLTQATDVFS